MIARVVIRSLRVAEHLLTGALIALYLRLRFGAGARPASLPGIVRWWHSRLCRALGVELRVEGRPAPHCLLVGNHISWLDIPVIGAQDPIGFLSKADVRRWPLIGWMAEVAGTRFIERGANQTNGVLGALRTDLAEGRLLMIFPEGTTTLGSEVKRFHPRLLAVVQGTSLGVQPVAIRYQRGDDPAPDAQVPYVGDDSLVANLWRLVRHPRLVASVQFLPPIQLAADIPRRAIADRARAAILEALDLGSLPMSEISPDVARSPSPAAAEVEIGFEPAPEAV